MHEHYQGIAAGFVAAIMAGDTEALRRIYAPEARIWHNGDGAEQTVEENLRTLRWLARNVRDLRYEEIRRDALAAGYVQRHVLRGSIKDGPSIEVPACLFVTIEDDTITRIEEYADSRATAPLYAYAAAQRAARKSRPT
jgi:ketosteroid isomerase-like protein